MNSEKKQAYKFVAVVVAINVVPLIVGCWLIDRSYKPDICAANIAAYGVKGAPSECREYIEEYTK